MIYLKNIFIVLILIYISFIWNDLYNIKYYEHQTIKDITSTLNPTITISRAKENSRTLSVFNISWTNNTTPLYKLIKKGAHVLEKILVGTQDSSTIRFFYFKNTLYNKRYMCLIYDRTSTILELVKQHGNYHDYTTTIDLDTRPITNTANNISIDFNALPKITYSEKNSHDNEYYELTFTSDARPRKIYDIYERTPIIKSLYNYSDTFHFMKSEPTHQYLCDDIKGTHFEEKDLIVNIPPREYNNMLQMYAKDVES